jgi:hypothetical protein
VDWKGALHTNTEGNLSNREALPEAAAPSTNHDPLKDLDPFPPGLRYSNVNLDAVTRAEVGQVVTQTWLLNWIGPVHGGSPRSLESERS